MANRLNVQNIYASDTQSTPSITIDSNGISAGTLGGGVVFPAGHVLQVVHADRTGKSNYLINSTSVVSADLDTGTITQKQTGSKILVVATVTQAPTALAVDHYRSGYVGFNTSTTGSYPGATRAYLSKGAFTRSLTDYNQYPQTVASWLIDTPSSSFTIYLVANASIASNYYIGGGSYYTALTVYEIAV